MQLYVSKEYAQLQPPGAHPGSRSVYDEVVFQFERLGVHVYSTTPPAGHPPNAFFLLLLCPVRRGDRSRQPSYCRRFSHISCVVCSLCLVHLPLVAQGFFDNATLVNEATVLAWGSSHCLLRSITHSPTA
jgi:hypothetical protein